MGEKSAQHHVVPDQPVLRPKMAPDALRPNVHAEVRPDPHTALPVPFDKTDVVALQAVISSEVGDTLDAAIRQHFHTGGAGDAGVTQPELSGLTLRQENNAIPGQSLGSGVGGPLAIFLPGE